MSALSQTVDYRQAACLEGSLSQGTLMHFDKTKCVPTYRAAAPSECVVLRNFLSKIRDILTTEQLTPLTDNYYKFCPGKVSQVFDDASTPNTAVQ